MAEAAVEPVESEFDKEAEPLGLTGEVHNDDEHDLRELLWSLQQLVTAKENIEERRQELQGRALPLLKRMGRPVMITHPVTGEVQIAAPREDEVLVVPADKLLAELVEHFVAEGYDKDEAGVEAGVIWEDVLKPPAVDTKEGGLFKKAVDQGRIPGHVVAKVASFQPKAPWVGFTKPRR